MLVSVVGTGRVYPRPRAGPGREAGPGRGSATLGSVSTEPVPVAILGSCISRDVFNSRFNPGYKATWNCVLMQNQSSLISIMSPAYQIPEEQLGDGMTDYARLQVRNDTSRVFLEKLLELRPEYLIVDFFGDIHFGVLEVGEGQYITNNRWMLHKTRWYAGRKAAGDLRPLRIEDDTEAYLALWKDALSKLTGFLREHLPETTVIVHRGRNAERWLAEGAARPKAMRSRKRLFKIDIDRANELWQRLDDVAAEVEGWESIDLTDREYLSFAGHPWGVFYVHYTLDYYDEFLAALNSLHLLRVLEEGSVEAAMAAQIAEARRSRHGEIGRLATEVRQLQQKLARLRSELAEARRPRRRLPSWLRRS
jgi:hypothetical protein